MFLVREDFPWKNDDPVLGHFTADWVRYSPSGRHVLMGLRRTVFHVDLQTASWRQIPLKLNVHPACGAPTDDGGYWLLYPQGIERRSKDDRITRCLLFSNVGSVIWSGTDDDGREWIAATGRSRILSSPPGEHMTFVCEGMEKAMHLPCRINLCDVWWHEGRLHALSLERNRMLVHWVWLGNRMKAVARLPVSRVSLFDFPEFLMDEFLALSLSWSLPDGRRIVRFQSWSVAITPEGEIHDFPWPMATPGSGVPGHDQEQADRTVTILCAMESLSRYWHPTDEFPYLIEVCAHGDTLSVVTTSGITRFRTTQVSERVQALAERIGHRFDDDPPAVIAMLSSPIPSDIRNSWIFRSQLCQSLDKLNDQSLSFLEQVPPHPMLQEALERDLVEMLGGELSLEVLRYATALLRLSVRSAFFAAPVTSALQKMQKLSLTSRAVYDALPVHVRKRVGSVFKGRMPTTSAMEKMLLNDSKMVLWGLQNLTRIGRRGPWVAEVMESFSEDEKIVKSVAECLSRARTLQTDPAVRKALGQLFDRFIMAADPEATPLDLWLGEPWQVEWILQGDSRFLARVREVTRMDQGIAHQAGHAVGLCLHYWHVPQALAVARRLVRQCFMLRPGDGRLLLCLFAAQPVKASAWVRLNEQEVQLFQRAGVDKRDPVLVRIDKLWRCYGEGDTSGMRWYLAAALLIQFQASADLGPGAGATATSAGASLLQRVRGTSDILVELARVVRQGPPLVSHRRVARYLLGRMRAGMSESLRSLLDEAEEKMT